MGILSSITEKVLAGILVLVLIASAGLGLLYRHEHNLYLQAGKDLLSAQHDRDTAVAANKALSMQNDAVNAAFNQLLKDQAALRLQQQAEKGALDEALKNHAGDWSNDTVPDDVWNGVFGTPQAASSAVGVTNPPASGANGGLPARSRTNSKK